MLRCPTSAPSPAHLPEGQTHACLCWRLLLGPCGVGVSEGEGADEPHRRVGVSLLPGSALSPSSIHVSLAVAPTLPWVTAPAFSHPRRSGSGRTRLESAATVSGGAHARSFRLPRGSAFCLVVSVNTGGWEHK